jgi:hypothetical protein
MLDVFSRMHETFALTTLPVLLYARCMACANGPRNDIASDCYLCSGLMKNRSGSLFVMIPFLFLAANMREC